MGTVADITEKSLEWLGHVVRLDHGRLFKKITLADLQLDTQNSYLFTYSTFIKILYMFRALPCSSSGGLRRNCSFLTSAQDSHLQRVTTPKAAYTELRRRPPENEQVMLETCRGF